MKTQLKKMNLIFTANLKYFLTIIIAFLAPIKFLLITVGLFIVADTIVGLLKAKKIKDKITSRKLSALVSKMLLYQAAIIMFFFLDKYILDEFINLFVSIPLFLTKVVAATLATIELISINENITIVTGINFWDKFKQILNRGKTLKKEFEDVKNS